MTNQLNQIESQQAHLTSAYILQDAHGKLYASQYRPTEDYRNHRTSANDIGAAACGCYIQEASHDLWLGDVVHCKVVIMAAWGLHTYTVKLKVVAKSKYVWDYSLPIGKRKVDNKETKNYRTLFTEYRNQSK